MQKTRTYWQVWVPLIHLCSCVDCFLSWSEWDWTNGHHLKMSIGPVSLWNDNTACGRLCECVCLSLDSSMILIHPVRRPLLKSFAVGTDKRTQHPSHHTVPFPSVDNTNLRRIPPLCHSVLVSATCSLVAPHQTSPAFKSFLCCSFKAVVWLAIKTMAAVVAAVVSFHVSLPPSLRGPYSSSSATLVVSLLSFLTMQKSMWHEANIPEN